MKKDELLKICNKLNPENEKGRLTLISRMGANNINKFLPPLIEIIKSNGLNVLWMCDPMHGNTYKLKSGYKTRDFDTIKLELQKFVYIVTKMNCFPGGVHFELTGDSVTECIGGIKNIKDDDLEEYYQTACDPRLNNEQSLEMAFLTAELLQKRRNNSE